MEKPAVVAHPIESLLQHRWSPRVFASKSVEREVLLRLFEAARWAPSSYNEQPWRYIVATQENPERLKEAQSVLSPGNAWATKAPVLICSVAQLAFARSDKPNRHAFHDVGAASENLLLQATALGLLGHQMAGFDVEKARVVFQIPEGYEPVAMMAVGYPGPLESLTEEQRAHEERPRVRRPVQEFVFDGRFGDPIEHSNASSSTAQGGGA
jgi:nitroreductase